MTMTWKLHDVLLMNRTVIRQTYYNRLLQMKSQRLCRNKAILMVCDIQEAFVPLMYKKEGMLEAAILMLKIANLYQLPVIATQHKTFGKVVPPLAEHLPATYHLVSKTSFSMINQETQSILKQYPGRTQIILIGVETHVCILQTFQDLLAHKYSVYLALDAVSSSRKWERSISIQRMHSQGAVLTTAETAAMEMLVDDQDQLNTPIQKVLQDLGSRQNAIDHL